jgi:HAMP domain-containing protein
MSPSLGGGGLFFDYQPWLLAGGSVLVLSVLFWLPFVRGVTRSITQLTRATEQIAEGRFDVRVNTRRQDELGSLAGFWATSRMSSAPRWPGSRWSSASWSRGPIPPVAARFRMPPTR